MFNYKRVLIFLLACFIIVFHLEASTELSVHLKVNDETGNKVDKFEVLCHSHGHGSMPWKPGMDGEITLTSKKGDFPMGNKVSAYCQLIIRSDEFAPEIITLEGPKGNIEKEIVLKKGRRELILTTADGSAIPAELEPMVVFSEFEEQALISYQNWSRGWPQSDLNMTSLVRAGDGRYVFNLNEDSSEFFIFIDHPGFMRAFRSGPYSVNNLQNNKLHIELPQPANAEVKFEPPDNWVGELPFKSCSVQISWNVPGTNSAYPVVNIKTEEPQLKMEKEYFAPGDYWIHFHTFPKETSEHKYGHANIGFYRDIERFSLEQGQSKTFTFKYIPHDPNGYKGDCNATFTVQWPDKQPAAGEPYSLYYDNMHYGSVLISEGMLNNEGKIDLIGLNSQKEKNHFTLLVREGELGRFMFELDCEQKSGNLVFSIAGTQGYPAPDITLQDITKNQEVKLSEFSGKIVFLEFWATWCGPCHGPMESLCKLQNKKTDWDGRVVLLAVSIDHKKETLINYAKNRGWSEVRHLWCHEGEKGFESKAAVAYGICGVPTALLIDKNGNIVWRGHPETVDIEAKIEELLKMNLVQSQN